MGFFSILSSFKEGASDQQKAQNANKRRQGAGTYLGHVARFFSIVLMFGVVTSLFFTTTTAAFSTALLWILATCLSGAAIGFLFGIPKILQSGKPKEGEANAENKEENGEYQLQVNTNLTEISDWLTKIIVGLGLVNLTKLPPYLHAVATLLANGICVREMGIALAFAYGLIICFTISGFLFGYLVTRLFLTKAFSKADQEAIRKVIDEAVEGKVAIVNESVASAKAQLANIENKQSVLAQTVFPEQEQAQEQAGDNEHQQPIRRGSPSTMETPGRSKEEALTQLQKLADEYLSINISDWVERIQQKDRLANRMGEYALKNNIKKDDVANMIRISGNEGLIIALATMIALRPESNDFTMLLEVGEKIKFRHVRYRVLVALGTLTEKKLVPPDNKNRLLALIDKYKLNADAPLMEMINNTISLVQSLL